MGNILKTAENKCSVDLIAGKQIEYLYEIKNNDITPSLDIKGSLPTSGYILMDSNCNGKMVNISNGKYFVNSEDDSVIVTDVAKKSELANTISYLYYIPEDNISEITLENVLSKNFSHPDISGIGTKENGNVLFVCSGFYTKNMDIENADKILKALNEKLKTDENNVMFLDVFKYYIDYDNKQIIFYNDLCKYFNSTFPGACNGTVYYLDYVNLTSDSQFYEMGGQKIIIK